MAQTLQPDDYLDLVRFRNDGEDFHVLWTARRALRILAPTNTLVAVAIEGVSSKDRYRGKPIAAGLLVADTVEYHGAETFDAAQHIVINQLKYSTTHPIDPWAWSGLEETIAGFATRFRAYVASYGVRRTLAVARFCFVTNRPISSNVLAAIAAANADTGTALTGHARKAYSSLLASTGLTGLRLRQFLSLLELRFGEPGREAQSDALEVETDSFQPRPSETSTARLKELIRTLGTSRGAHDPVVRIESVLRSFGIDDPAQLLPSPSHFEQVVDPVPRAQDDVLAAAIRDASGPLLVTAPSGVGKSVTAQQIPKLMPEGSETIVFDGFAGGGYRAPSEARHRHDLGLVQIANELAARGLCDVLLPTAAPRHEYLRAFRVRLAQAAAIVGARHIDAIVVIVLDAADNSLFAAELQRDECFVRDLMMEAPPPGCRIVALARPNRVDGLVHAGQPDPFQLRPFELLETTAFVGQYQFGASEHVVAAFHRLTFGNPRVQANQLAAASDLEAAVEALGPQGQTVDALIEQQLLAGLEAVKTLQPEADIDTLCTALAALPPLVPIDVLAAVANVQPSSIASFAADFAGGRPLLLDGDHVQFRDEPVETWFINRFLPDGPAASVFADRIAKVAETDSYAALALPQLLERAGRHEALLGLALGDGGDFDADPIERRHITLHRVRFALKSAFTRNAFTEVAKLLIRAGEEVAASERQSQFLADNADLVASLTGPATVDDFVYRRRAHGAWFGSANAYNAAMLAGTAGRDVEVRTYLSLAERWLNEWVNSSEEERMNHPLQQTDLAAMAFAFALLDGPAEFCDFVARARSSAFRFAIAQIAFEKLADIGRADLVHDACAQAKELFTRLAAVSVLRSRGDTPKPAVVEATLALFVETQITERFDDYEHQELHASFLTLAECAVAAGFRDGATAILAAGYWSISDHPFPDPSNRIATGLRAIALMCLLEGQDMDRAAIWRKSHPNARPEAKPGHAFNAILDLLLPTFDLRARSFAGPVADLQAALKASHRASAMVAFSSHDERYLRGIRFLAEVEILHNQGALNTTTLGDAEKALRASEHGPFPHESYRVIHLIAKDPALHREALRLAASAAAINELEHEDASSKATAYANLARVLLPISHADAISYFLRGIEIVDRVGEEMHERLFMLIGLANAAGAGRRATAEDAYRLLRIAEIYEAVNSHKFPWHSVAAAALSLDAGAALAAVSRLDSRRVTYLTMRLPDLLERLLLQGRISLQAATAFHVLGGVWDFDNLASQLAAVPLEQRARIVDELAADMIDARIEAWNMRKFMAAAREHGLSSPYLETIYAQREARDRQRSGGAGSFFAPDEAREPIDWPSIFEGLDLLTADDIGQAYSRWRTGRARASLAEFGAAMRATTTVAQWSSHVVAIGACDELDIDDATELLATAAEAWSSSAAVRDRLKSAVDQVVQNRAVELASATYLWNRHLPRLAKLADCPTSALVKQIAARAGPHIVHFGSSSLFSLAHKLSEELFEANEALDVLRFALDRFERILKPTDADGAYGEDLDPAPELGQVLAGLLWTHLGDPDREDRWRAAHVVRRLARHGETKLLADLIAWAQAGHAGANLTRGFPFYLHFARLHLLVGLARIALEAPSAIAPLREFLGVFAARSHPHVFERYYAGQALLALAASGHIHAGAEDLENWSNLLTPLVGPSDELGEEEDRETEADDEATQAPTYYLPHDITKKWGRPIASAFALREAEFNGRVAQAIERDIGVPPNRRWDDDPRAQHGVYRTYGRSRTELETLSDYQADSGIAIVLGELLDERAPRGRYAQEDLKDLFAERLLVRSDGKWLSDRRDPTPVSGRPWLEGAYEQDWSWNVVAADFQAMLFAHEGRFCIAGDWTESDHYKTESIEVSSALARAPLAGDLLRACQLNFRQSFFALPNDQWSRRAAGTGFALTSWVGHPDRHHGLDDDDPLAGAIRFPPFVPGRVLKRIFGFTADQDYREWRGAGRWSDLVLSSRVWGEPRLQRDDDKPVEGEALIADLDVVLRILTILNRSLIVRVAIRRSDSFSGEKELTYVPPYTRYFVLDRDGQLHWLRGSGPARPSSDRPT